MTAPVTIVASLRPDLLAYVFHALRRQAEWYRRNGMNPPSGVDQLVEVLASRASQGQPGTTLAASTPTGEVERMAPRLVRYETAAELLDCSVRQVKRLVSDQQLAQVAVGGLKRIRVTDIDMFIDKQVGTADPQGGS
jgi:excisionase family DNA binding protein